MNKEIDENGLYLPRDLCKHISDHLCSPSIECDVEKEILENNTFLLWFVWITRSLCISRNKHSRFNDWLQN